MNVLILTSSAGGGHTKAAEALKEYIEQRNPSSKAQIIDALKYVSPVIDKLILGGYLKTVKSTPALYGKLYDISESKNNIYHLSCTLSKALSSKMMELVTKYEPSVVVCTHAFPLQILSALVKSQKLTCPVVAIITDFTIHDFWIYDNVDAYVVANQTIKNEMLDRGIPEDTVYPFGIPVSKSFLEHRNKNEILKSYDLQENLLTVLVAGGSLGYGEIREVIKHLCASKIDMQIIVLAGKNKRLKSSLEKQIPSLSKVVKVFGYIDSVSAVMDASDLIITKPGGLTISEALIKQLPVFLISPIPGQEKRNAEFLLNYGAAITISRYENIETQLRILLDNPSRKQYMMESAKLIAKPYASRDTTILIETLSGYCSNQNEPNCVPSPIKQQ